MTQQIETAEDDLLEFYADPASWAAIGYDPFPLGRPSIGVAERPRTVPLVALRAEYDVVVVGAGAGGGVVACVLAEAGASVLVVERGEWLTRDDIAVDHLRNHRFNPRGDSTSPPGHPRVIVGADGAETIVGPEHPGYQNNAITAGGGSRLFGAQAWRFLPDDFRMASRYGVPEGSALADWPIDYEDLAPFYDKVEWAVGVCGAEGHAFEPAHERPYPMPPFPLGTDGALLADAAATLGWPTAPVPLLVNSVARDGRAACVRCGFCVGFPCPVDAKNGTNASLLPRAAAAGTDIAVATQAVRVSDDGTVELASGDERRSVRAQRIVLAGGAIETARLLLASGLGNEWVGNCLQGHSYAGAMGLFDEVILDGLGPGPSIATRAFSHGHDGIVGGGLLANEFVKLPALHFAWALPPGTARSGAAAHEAMRRGYQRTMHVMGPAQEIPVRSARVGLSTTAVDRYGMPVARLSGVQHPHDLDVMRFLSDRASEWIAAAGATRTWPMLSTTRVLSAGQHQAGTARMAESAAHGATDHNGKVFGTERVWVADASLHVTNGGCNPVLTIMALAWRAGERLAQLG